MKRGLQLFSQENLETGKKMSPTQIVEFLENYRHLFFSNEKKDPRKLISLRVPQTLLDAFKMRSKFESKKYQTQIVDLMREWVGDGRKRR